MLLSAAMTLVLRRTGLSTSNTDYRDRARAYLFQSAIELASLQDWWWLNADTTFDTVADTRTCTPISTQVTAWYSAVNETSDNPIVIVGPDEYDLLDLDRDETGTVEALMVGGVDSTTGKPVLELWRTPDAVYTIRLRYQLAIIEWTSSNDASTLMVLGLPQVGELAAISGAAQKYLEEQGNMGQAMVEEKNLARQVLLLQKQNVRMQGNRRYPADPPSAYDPLVLRYGTDAVTV